MKRQAGLPSDMPSVTSSDAEVIAYALRFYAAYELRRAASAFCSQAYDVTEGQYHLEQAHRAAKIATDVTR